MSENILIGKVISAHGIKGELKISPLTDSIEVFLKIKKCIIDNVLFDIEKSRDANGTIIVKLKNISTRNLAETLKGDVFARKDQIPLEEGRFFISDIIGFLVVAGDIELGALTEVYSFGTVDTYFVSGERGNFSFPALKEVILEIDLSKKVILLDENQLRRVIVYEN